MLDRKKRRPKAIMKIMLLHEHLPQVMMRLCALHFMGTQLSIKKDFLTYTFCLNIGT